jgi:flagellar basal-body rod modification protein FlgD
MAAMAGILNHQMTAGQALTANGANPMASATAGSGAASGADSAGGDSATISANDFLTLLVTEMQNQDPTAQTDPNEYINQLVQVNSLEQLIDINQNLTSAIGTSGGAGSSSPGGAAASVPGAGPAGATATVASAMTHKAGAQTAAGAATSSPTGTSHAPSSKPGSSTVAAISQFAQSVNARSAPGNLSVPAAKPASHTVGHALDGHSHPSGIPGK